MTGARWRSALLAALFALHPLHVESVAWLSERKDVLSTLFFMLTLLAYQSYTRVPSAARYGLVALFTTLGLMSKPMLVTLPLVLLLLDYWPLRRFSGRSGAFDSRAAPGGYPARSQNYVVLLEKVPLVALAAASSVVTLLAQSRMGATAMLGDELTLGTRLGNALVAYVTYLGMTLWPARLAVFYPYVMDRPAWQIAVSAALLLTITAAAVGLGRRRPYFAVGWFWYLGTLVPVLGLVQVGAQAMADRYTYIPLVGVFLAAVWGAAEVGGGAPHPAASCERTSRRVPRLAWAGAAAGVLLACLILTQRQVGYWADSESLFRHAVDVTRDNPVAREALGSALLRRGNSVEAEAEFRQALRLNSEKSLHVCSELAKALEQQGRREEAIDCLRCVVGAHPELAWAKEDLAKLLAPHGQAAEAITLLREVVAAHPEDARAKNDLAMLLAPRGQVAEAIGLLRAALDLQPDRPEGLQNLAWILATCPERRFRDGREAVALARRACDLSARQNPKYLCTLADAYLETGEIGKAAEGLQAALRLQPEGADIQRRLGKVLQMLGRPMEAAQHMQAAERLKGQGPPASSGR